MTIIRSGWMIWPTKTKELPSYYQFVTVYPYVASQISMFQTPSIWKTQRRGTTQPLSCIIPIGQCVIALGITTLLDLHAPCKHNTKLPSPSTLYERLYGCTALFGLLSIGAQVRVAQRLSISPSVLCVSTVLTLSLLTSAFPSLVDSMWRSFPLVMTM